MSRAPADAPTSARATGETSEAAIRALYGLPDHALIEMGDFVGGLLKYLREHPVPRLTIAGGPAKMTKLAEGKLDLHSKRGAVDLAALGERVALAGGAPSLSKRSRAPTAACTRSNSLKPRASTCRRSSPTAHGRPPRASSPASSGELETIVVGRDGRVLASSGFRRVRFSGLVLRRREAASKDARVRKNSLRSLDHPSRRLLRRLLRMRSRIATSAGCSNSFTRPAPARRQRETAAHNPRCKARSRESPRPRAPGRRG